MEDKLVTLAIRTFHRAQMIKSVLEQNGIETVIHNLNLEQPELAVGVRVRIRESDLPRALKIVEDMENAWETEKVSKSGQKILVPIDFADQVDKTIDFGFHFAKKHNAEVVFLYVYFSPTFTISAHNDLSTYSIGDSDLLRRAIASANTDISNLNSLLKSRIEKGELPYVSFSFELKEGVAEDQIIEYCKKNNPIIVVMGTHGKRVSNELIGSVTAEVIESTTSPVFAVPVQAPLKNPEQIKRVAFLTNFDQKDLIAIDKTIELINRGDLEIFFIHASEKSETWSEVLLAGIKTYFSSHYPDIKTNYALIGNDESPEFIDDYLHKKNIDLLAFNSRRRNLFSRLFNTGLAYKLVLHSDTLLFVTHV